MAENFPVQAGAPASVNILARQVQQAFARFEARQNAALAAAQASNAEAVSALDARVAANEASIADHEARITDLETP